MSEYCAGCAGSGSGELMHTDSRLTLAHRLDHLLARWGVRRHRHRVEPGLYAFGSPGPDSPVFVSANYTLSFDALRRALAGIDAYILVLDTRGINVWCAAGKGTFGTDELVNRMAVTGLEQRLSHRRLILPQLGASGVSAHEVQQRSGFRVVYGPVRAADLPAYLKGGTATPGMRTVTFRLSERLPLIPVELVQALLPLVLAAVGLFFLGGPWASLAAVAVLLAGCVLFPILLPWLPTRGFSSKGWILGVLVALPFAALAWLARDVGPTWLRAGAALGPLLALPPATAYLALQFTGSSTFTSRTGVRREIFAYVPWMAVSLLLGLVLSALARWLPLRGGA